MITKREIKRQIRYFQTYVPQIRAVKFAAYNWATRNFGLSVEPEFKLLERLAPFNLAVDVGGNWGQSIYALKRYACPEKLISFEPNPQLAARLKGIFTDDPTVAVEAVALGATPGEFELYLPSYRGFDYDGLASLDYDSAAGWLNSKRMARFEQSKLQIKQHRVQVRTLDSYRLTPDIMKIDVQGYEEAVIEGAQETLARSQPFLIIEDPTPRLISMLSDFGLSHFGLVNGSLIPGALSQPNSLFMTDARRNQLKI